MATRETPSTPGPTPDLTGADGVSAEAEKSLEPSNTTPPEATEPTEVTASSKSIKFTGFSGTIRRINAADLRRAGFEGDLDDKFVAEWSPENGHTVKADSFSEDLIALLVRDPELSLVEKS